MTLSRLVATLAALTILAVVAEFFLTGAGEHVKEHSTYHVKEHSTYFVGLFALVSVAAAIVLIGAAALLWRFLLHRPEDYYD